MIDTRYRDWVLETKNIDIKPWFTELVRNKLRTQILEDNNIKPNVKMTLLAIMKDADEYGMTNITNKKLAVNLSRSAAAVSSHIAFLKKYGVIYVINGSFEDRILTITKPTEDE